GPDPETWLRGLAAWDCRFCWTEFRVRVQWLCRPGLQQLRAAPLGAVQDLLKQACREAAFELGLPERDLHWRFLGRLVVPYDTQTLPIVALAPIVPRPRRAGAAGEGRPAAPARHQRRPP